MATCLSASDHACQILGEFVKRYVAHVNLEALCPGTVSLSKRDVAAQSRFNREAFMTPNVILDESFELPIYDRAYFQRNASIGTVVQFRASIISVERIDTKTMDRERNRLSAAWRASNNDHSRAH